MLGNKASITLNLAPYRVNIRPSTRTKTEQRGKSGYHFGDRLTENCLQNTDLKHLLPNLLDSITLLHSLVMNSNYQTNTCCRFFAKSGNTTILLYSRFCRQCFFVSLNIPRIMKSWP